MKENNEKICRFCLKNVNDRYLCKIDQMVRKILNVLCLKVNLDISEDPIMCMDCRDNLFKTFDFKSACIGTEDNLLPFINFESDSKINMQEVYLNINGYKSIEGKNVCRFCMNEVPSECSILLNELIEDMMVKKNVLEEYFPEMNLYLVKNPIICQQCVGSLKDYLAVITNWVNVEERVQSYIKREVSNAAKIDLSNVQQFLEKSEVKMEVGLFTDINETEQGYYKFLQDIDIKTELKNEDPVERDNLQLTIKTEQVELNVDEDESFQDIPFTSQDIIKQEMEDPLRMNDAVQIGTSPTYKCDRCTFHTVYANVYNKHMVIHESEPYIPHDSENGASCTKHKYSFNSVYKCDMYKAEFENNMKQHRLKHKQHKYKASYKESSTVGHKREDDNCLYKTKYKSTLKKGNPLTHSTSSEATACKGAGHLYKRTSSNQAIIQKNPSEGVANKCENENDLYETVDNGNPKRYILDHKIPLKIMSKCECENCSYKHKWKAESSALTLYVCGYANCFYKTKLKCNLNNHMLVHKNLSELMMLEDDNENCSYKTNRMPDLKEHMLIHKNSPELTVYKCGYKNCLYETKLKSHIRKHILDHFLVLTRMYKCEYTNCSFKTKWKSCLKTHELIHKNSSELTMYKCEYENCSYEAKIKSRLKTHMLVHKHPSELTTYKCDYKNCLYETNIKRNFKRHSLVHKNRSGLTMYKCDYKNCLYETNLKSNLKTHLLVHKDRSELTMYKCEYENCLYEAKVKSSLKSHMLVHKRPSELTTYKCDYENCLYKTNIKGNLKRHMLAHKNPSELTMYKCGYENCFYKAKDKYHLKIHMLVHNHPSKLHKCEYENCLFTTKRKSDLKHHVLIHKNS